MSNNNNVEELMHDFNLSTQKTKEEIEVINEQIEKFPDLFKDASDKFMKDVNKAVAQDTGQSEVFNDIRKEMEKRKSVQTQHSHIVSANKDFSGASLVDEEVYYTIVARSYSNKGMTLPTYYTNDVTMDKSLVEDADILGIVHESSVRYANMFKIKQSSSSDDSKINKKDV